MRSAAAILVTAAAFLVLPSLSSASSASCSAASARQALLHTAGVPAAARQTAALGLLKPVMCWDINGDGRRDLVIGLRPPFGARAATSWLALVSTGSGYRSFYQGPYPWVTLTREGSGLLETTGVYERGDKHGQPSGFRARSFHWQGGTFSGDSGAAHGLTGS